MSPSSHITYKPGSIRIENHHLRHWTLHLKKCWAASSVQQWWINSCVLSPPTTQTHYFNWSPILIFVPILMVFISHNLSWIEGDDGFSCTSPWFLLMHSDVPPIGDHSYSRNKLTNRHNMLGYPWLAVAMCLTLLLVLTSCREGMKLWWHSTLNVSVLASYLLFRLIKLHKLGNV